MVIQVIKFFALIKKGFIEFGDDVDPLFTIYAVKNKTIENDFLNVSEIKKCPKCRSKLHKYGKDKFEINNTVFVEDYTSFYPPDVV